MDSINNSTFIIQGNSRLIIFKQATVLSREEVDRQKMKACAHLVCQQKNNITKRENTRNQYIHTIQTLCPFRMKTCPTDLQPVNTILFYRACKTITPNSN